MDSSGDPVDADSQKTSESFGQYILQSDNATWPVLAGRHPRDGR
jgi:hypothetical protein